MAQVGDLGLLGGLAKSRGRLALAGAASLVVNVAMGVGIARFVNETSGSVVMNMGLITLQFFVALFCGYVLAMLAGALIFGDVWRRQTLLGERVEDEGVAALRDHSLAFYGVFALCTLAAYLSVHVATDDYMGRYNEVGYYATLLRSPNPDDRVRALRALVDPVHERSAETREVRAVVAAAVADPHDEVRGWAAWTAGHTRALDAQPALLALLSDEGASVSSRVEAAHALGRLADREAEARMIGMLPAAAATPQLAQAMVTGLGLMASVDALDAYVAMLGTGGPQLDAALFWSIRKARRTSPREPVLTRWRASQTPADRCAAAEALKMVTIVEDDATLRAAFDDAREAPDCERVAFEERHYDPEEPMQDIVYVVAEPLRQKYLTASFNIRGPGLEEWLADIAWREGESDRMKVYADRLYKALMEEPLRVPRDV